MYVLLGRMAHHYLGNLGISMWTRECGANDAVVAILLVLATVALCLRIASRSIAHLGRLV